MLVTRILRPVFVALAVGSLLPIVAIAVTCTARAIPCGSTTNDSLGPGSSCVIDTFPTANYSFNGTTGQIVNIVASNTTGMDMFVTLSNSAGRVTTSYLDEPASISVTLPTTDQYVIAINFGNPHTSGSYTLALSCTTATAPAGSCTYTATVQVGDSVSGQLSSSDTACGSSSTYAKAYKVIANAGDAFSIDYSTTYPAYIEVRGPDKSGAFRMEVGAFLRMDYVVPVAGNVTVFVASSGTSPLSGNFTLTLKPLLLPVCGKARAVRH